MYTVVPISVGVCMYVRISAPMSVGVLYTMGSDIQGHNLSHSALFAPHTEGYMD